jgi:hypothetical protein
MPRPAENMDANAKRFADILDQIGIAARAYRAAHAAADPRQRGALYDIAIGHFAATAAQIEKEKRNDA